MGGSPGSRDPWIWVKIDPDGVVSVVLARCEMGQGSMTGLAMLVAEELDVEWEGIRTEWAQPPDPAIYGSLLTGASNAIRTHWEPLRKAGAIARSLLVSAAAARWSVDEGECATRRGTVVHPASGRSLPYGALAEPAARLPLPSRVELESPDEFTLIGRSPVRLDLPAKVRGEALFGIDVKVPDMLVATIVHCPVYYGVLEDLDSRRTLEVPGVRHVVRLSAAGLSSVVTAVAVVADSFWAARRGAAALELRWREGRNAGASSEQLRRELERLARTDARPAVTFGDAGKALASASRTLSATYSTPYLAHATMEPMNCTARIQGGRCEIWVPTQDPARARRAAAREAGIAERNVVVHPTYLGGGFGRRQATDFVAQAVEIARAVGAPVKLIWSREEDIGRSLFRPLTVHHLEAGLDRRGLPVAWWHRIGGMARSDTLLIQGVDDLPYAIPHRRVDLFRRGRGPVRTGPWRGLARSQNCFATECFLDEVARAGGQDPLELRLRLLRDAPRYRNVLEIAAEQAGWGRPRAAGRHVGIAVGENFGAACAEVAEVSITEGNEIRVHRIVCAADCGHLVHPDAVAAQMEGGIIFGLSAALKGAITLRDGRVEQSNFHDYPIVRMPEAPAIDVHLVTSREDPKGVGETSLPPIAPAVANAVFAATGRRIRELPLRLA